MKNKLFICILFTLLFPLKLYAIDGQLITTIDYSIEDKWYKTQGESVPVMSTVSSVIKEQYFIIALVLRDYSINQNKDVNVVFDLAITDPNNKIYYSNKNITALKMKTFNQKNLLLSQNLLKVNFEKDKPLGNYLINIKLRDLISNKEKALSQSITLKEYEHKEYFSDDKEFGEWANNYYVKPSPEKAIDAYLYFSKSKLNEKESSFAPMFTFFLSIFNNNKYLIPYFVNNYSEQDLKTKIYLVYLFRYVDYDLTRFFNNLKDQGKVVYDGIKNKPYEKNPYDKIVDGGQLDMLWGEFYATGNFKPIYRIIETLDYQVYNGYLAKYKELKNPSADDKQKAIYNAIFNAAVWSLGSNCNQHKLVKEYCVYVIKNYKMNNSIKTSLENILAE